ncbi:hypothetical protein FRC16_006244 [Serendipita sp. 398]|nr:hypothetical protein FRC16_006244 [Serendipita sp. 398]
MCDKINNNKSGDEDDNNNNNNNKSDEDDEDDDYSVSSVRAGISIGLLCARPQRAIKHPTLTTTVFHRRVLLNSLTWKKYEDARLHAAFQSAAPHPVSSDRANESARIQDSLSESNDLPNTCNTFEEIVEEEDQDEDNDNNNDSDNDNDSDEGGSVALIPGPDGDTGGGNNDSVENDQFASMEEFDHWLHNQHDDEPEGFVDPYGLEELEDREEGDGDIELDVMEDMEEDDQEPLSDLGSFRSDGDATPKQIDKYPRAGEIKEKRQSRFEDILARQDIEESPNIFRPFKDSSEFRLARWLNDLPLSKARSSNLSFGSGKTMRQRIDQLPTPRMQWKNIQVDPLYGTTSAPVYLSYRDPVNAIRSLLDRPELAKYMTYTPERHWKDKAEYTRVYSEIFTADWAWDTQASLEPGSTLLAVLLGSDKAHLTEHSGDKSAWPLYLSLGNIHSSIRNKPTKRCWILLAYIPIPSFTDPKAHHTALQQRLFHQCLEVVLKSIKRVGKKGKHLRDSLGNVRHCYTRIAAYLADYPEQTLINATAQNNSPNTTAGHHELGDSAPRPRRTREWILSRIAQAKQIAHPSNIEEYTEAAKQLGLNSVDRPFWRGHAGYQPDLVITPDILHGLFRFWRDHILKWVRYLIGAAELDHRLKALQPISGFRHFAQGISHLSQWTGREDRELQRVLVSVVVGSPKINTSVLRALRAFHDFLYLAQYRSHSTSTLQYLKEALETFHEFKDAFIKTGARRGKNGIIQHFRIPKMAGLHSYAYHIPLMGTSVQFSTEITETCHQEMAKAAYKATNRKNFFQQMAAYMNRKEVLTLMEDISSWYFERLRTKASCGHAIPCLSGYETFVSEMVIAGQKDAELEVRRASRAKGGYIWLTIKPDRRGILIDTVVGFYNIPNLHTDLVTFMGSFENVGLPLRFSLLRSDVWYRCRIQRPTIQDEDELGDTRVIQAVPPNVSQNRHGLCNCVLVKSDDDAEETGIAGYRIAQLRLIFMPRLPQTHPLYDVPLAYIYWFSHLPSRTERNINMYQVHCLRESDRSHIGEVIPLSSICRLVQLVPKFGNWANPELTKDNSMDVWKYYYLNSFMDKETYQAVW